MALRFIASGKVTELFFVGLHRIGYEPMKKPCRTESEQTWVDRNAIGHTFGDANSRMEMYSTPAQDVDEIRPTQGPERLDLIYLLRTRPNMYAGPAAV